MPIAQLSMSEYDALPTSADVDRCVKEFCDSPPDPASFLPSTYTSIIHAGSGTFGDVYFCIPTSAITASMVNSTAQTEVTTACTHLTKQLVAIKVCHGPSIPTLCNELAVLQIIATTNHAAAHNAACDSNDTSCDAFFEVLDHATCPNDDAHYFTTTTLPLVCTLDALKSYFSSLPEVFTWLIYTRVGTALHWLNKTCDPGVAHGDLHPGNILIGYAFLLPTEGLYLPQIKLIDFGKSRIANAEPGYEYALCYDQTLRDDKSKFLYILAAMMGVVSFDGRPPNRSPKPGAAAGRTMDSRESREFSEFRTGVDRAVRRNSWDCEDSIVELEGLFRRIAEGKVEGAKVGEAKKIWGVMMDVAEERCNGVQEKIEELIAGGPE